MTFHSSGDEPQLGGEAWPEPRFSLGQFVRLGDNSLYFCGQIINFTVDGQAVVQWWEVPPGRRASEHYHNTGKGLEPTDIGLHTLDRIQPTDPPVDYEGRKNDDR